MTWDEVSEILDLALRSNAEKDQLLAALRDGGTIEVFGVAVITPAGHGLYVGNRKDGGQ